MAIHHRTFGKLMASVIIYKFVSLVIARPNVDDFKNARSALNSEEYLAKNQMYRGNNEYDGYVQDDDIDYNGTLLNNYSSMNKLEYQYPANESLNSMTSYLKQLREQIKVLASDTYRNERIFYGIAYFAIVISSLFGNMLVCRICFKKKTKTNALIMSLAISDLMMTMFNIPFNFFRITNFSWPFGSAMCFIVNFVQHLVVYISSYTMAIIAIQRYQSVSRFKMDKYQQNSHHSNCTIAITVEQQNINSNHNNSNETSLKNSNTINFRLFCYCLYVCLYPFRCLKKTTRLCSINHRDYKMFSMGTICITIVITWLCSALLSLLFTYSSMIVMRKDSTYVLEVLIRELYHNHSTMDDDDRHHNVFIANQSINNINQMNDSIMKTITISSPSTTTTTQVTSLNDNENQFVNDNELDYINHFLQEQTDSSNHIVRCINPITENVKIFFDRTFSMKADFIKTITIFVTQYFIPLAIICYLYVKIGKIIYQQGKLCNDQGNAKAKIRQRKKLRRMLMLILMVAVFAVCWLPLHIFHILTDAGLINYNYQAFMMVHWLAMSSVSYNPFIYCWLNPNFRKAALMIFCCGNSNKKASKSNSNNVHQQPANANVEDEVSLNYSRTLLNKGEEDKVKELSPPTQGPVHYLGHLILDQFLKFFKPSNSVQSSNSSSDGEPELIQHLGICNMRESDPSMVSQCSFGQTSNFQLEFEMEIELKDLNTTNDGGNVQDAFGFNMQNNHLQTP